MKVGSLGEREMWEKMDRINVEDLNLMGGKREETRRILVSYKC